MFKFNNIVDLQSLIENAVDENTELEYKLCFGDSDEETKNGVKQLCCGKKKKDWRAEFVKDASGMANANGIWLLAQRRVFFDAVYSRM